MDTLLSNISVITMDERMQVLTDAFVGVTEGKISWLAKKPPEEKPGQIIDGTGMVLIPGLVNCHTQVERTLLRGYGEDLNVAQRLGEKIYPRLERMDDRAAKAAATLGMAQCLRMGVTSISDMGRHLDAIAQAAAECGIRANLSPELTDLLGEEYDPERDPAFQELEAAAEKWQGHEGRITIEAGLQGEYTASAQLLHALAGLRAEKGLGLHLNLSQFPWENEDCLDRTGLTPAQLLELSGVFSGRTVAVHCNCMEDEDVALLGRRKASVVCCPESDLKQAAGRTDILALVKAGCNVALGTDFGPVDLLGQARLAAQLAKNAAGDPETLNAQAALLMATVCGAKAQGRGDTGMIKVGCVADLVALDFTQPHLIPCHDLISAVVHEAAGRDVCMTMVAGQILYASGRFMTIDLNAVMQELAEYAMEKVFGEEEA